MVALDCYDRAARRGGSVHGSLEIAQDGPASSHGTNNVSFGREDADIADISGAC